LVALTVGSHSINQIDAGSSRYSAVRRQRARAQQLAMPVIGLISAQS
jgi:hypothetical protein